MERLQGEQVEGWRLILTFRRFQIGCEYFFPKKPEIFDKQEFQALIAQIANLKFILN